VNWGVAVRGAMNYLETQIKLRDLLSLRCVWSKTSFFRSKIPGGHEDHERICERDYGNE
jgi:hypothetical protein